MDKEKSVTKRPHKFIIGLTGNIGTGKSVVRRMLEHLGAFGIDADLVGHDAFNRGSSSYERVLKMFGPEILSDLGEIDRQKLGKIVFSSPKKLEILETIVHPYVVEKIDDIISKSPSPVVVLEAIKLLEGGLDEICDTIWVTHTPEENQVQRLVDKRKMSHSDAHRRVSVQSPQTEKVNRADVVIHTNHTFVYTWEQVLRGWNECVPQWAKDRMKRYDIPRVAYPGLMVIQPDPSLAESILNFYQKMLPSCTYNSVEGITSLFAENRFLLLIKDQKISGSLEFQLENHISKTVRIVLDKNTSDGSGLSLLIKRMEKISQDYFCQGAFILPGDLLASYEAIWKELGYQLVKGKALEKESWQRLAMELIRLDTGLLFSILG